MKKFLPVLMFGLMFGVALFVPTSARAEEPQGTARNKMAEALGECRRFMKTATSPGLLTVEDYYAYIGPLREARRADTEIDAKTKTWSAVFLGQFVPKDQYATCVRFVGDYEKGVEADKNPKLSAVCQSNVEKNLAGVKSEMDIVRNEKNRHHIWFARNRLEDARFQLYLTGGIKQPPSQSCAPNDRFKKAFAPLEAKFKAAESELAQFEATQNVKFRGVEQSELSTRAVTLVFVDAKTNAKVNL